MSNEKKLVVGMVVFPNLTMLDFVGPYDVFSKASCFKVVVISRDTRPLQAEGGLTFQASVDFEHCPQLDVIFVPGGKGINPILTDKTYINFLQRQANEAQYITSVCTGSLVLAAAGLLTGYKATTHWRSLDLLRLFNIETIKDRVVVDRNRITGGGVTSGIDFGLVLTAMVGGEAMAKTIQLMLEYEPVPPFHSGSPEHADADVLEKANNNTQAIFDERVNIIKSLL